MYIIIKKDKAEHLSEKLHKIKGAVCDIMEELEYAARKEYEENEIFRSEHSRHSGRRHEDDYEDFDRERDFDRHYSRGRSGGGRGGRY